MFVLIVLLANGLQLNVVSAKDVTSPDLFARYTDRIMRVVKELEGVHVGGVNINNILYADDTTLIAD